MVAYSGVIHSPEQLLAIDQVVAIAEFDIHGTLRQANDNFLALLGYGRHEAVGRHHRDFCTPAFASGEEYRAFWPNLCNGGATTGLVERMHQNGTSRWLEAVYTPVRNPEGTIQSILKIATDVTARIQREREQAARLHRLSLVADASATAIVISDGNFQALYVNQGFTNQFGWSLNEIEGKPPISVLAPHLDPAFIKTYRDSLDAGEQVEREEIVTSKQGQKFWVKAMSNPVMDPVSHRMAFTVTTLTDITRAKMHEVLQYRVLEAMARETPLTEVLELVCREVERMAPEILASVLAVDDQGRLHPLVGPSLPDAYSQQLDGLPIGPAVGSCGTAAWRNEPVCVDDIASSPLWEHFKHLALPQGLLGCWSTPIRNSRGDVIGTFAFYFKKPRQRTAAAFHQQIVDGCVHLCALAMVREQSRQRIRQLAFYDSLTGLPNRSLLLVKADHAITAASQSKAELAVVFIDLNRFKQVNDSLGHPAGDELLKQIASQLRQELRPSDIAGRLSGDEFVVVLPHCNAATATDAVERLLALLGQSRTIAGTSVVIAASAGVAMYPHDGLEMETLVHRADMAMYQAKHRGHGCFSFFDNEMNELAQARLALEAALRQALQNNQLHLHYQPQIDMKTGRVYGVEALARWTHSEFGDVPPARFIPLAEECGLVADLGRWALREACRQLAHWRALGLAIPAVAVNLSPTSFHNLDLPRMISDTLDNNNLKPDDLTLEITENVLLDTNPSTTRTIAAVHEQGVRLSMDDFGTGYSSLSYLRRLPVSELKLDQSFVADLESDEAARALSAAILSIGKSLHLTVVAEGVETESQRFLLSEQGYPVAQGYLFARPMPAPAFEHWFQQLNHRADQPSEVVGHERSEATTADAAVQGLTDAGHAGD